MQTKARAVEIRISRKKLLLLLAGSILLFLTSTWIIFGNVAQEQNSWMQSTKALVAGYAGTFFFGLTTIALSKKFFDAKPGLVIDEMGITDHSSAVSAGFISWSEIENISRFEIRGQHFISIQVKDPDHFIEKQTGSFKRKAMALNNRLYGTPIFISANSLEIEFEELFMLIQERKRISCKL